MVYLGDPQMYHKMRNLSDPGLSSSKTTKKSKKLKAKKNQIKNWFRLQVKLG